MLMAKMLLRDCSVHSALAYRKEDESEYEHRGRVVSMLASRGYVLLEKFQENGCEALVTKRLVDRGLVGDLIVSVRGTERTRDGLPWWLRLFRSEWALDGWGAMVKDPVLDGMVHQGFEYHSAPMVNTLYQYLLDNPCHQVHFTGHSLGGAVASRLSAVCGVKGVPVGVLVTFGAPAVGDDAWATHVEQVAGYPHCYRVVNCGDVIPRLKMQWLTSMLQGSPVRHAGQVLYLNRHHKLEQRTNWFDRYADRTSARVRDWRFLRLGYEHHSMKAYAAAIHSVCSL